MTGSNGSRPRKSALATDRVESTGTLSKDGASHLVLQARQGTTAARVSTHGLALLPPQSIGCCIGLSPWHSLLRYLRKFCIEMYYYPTRWKGHWTVREMLRFFEAKMRWSLL